MVYLFNTTICTGTGVWTVREITDFKAKKIIAEVGEYTSAIGHEATAIAMSEILGQDVPVNRIQAQLLPGDVAICLKLNGRLPEGQILGLEELQKIGFTLYEMVLHPFSIEEMEEAISEHGFVE